MAKKLKLLVFVTMAAALIAPGILAAVEPCFCHSSSPLFSGSEKQVPPCHAQKNRGAKGVVNTQHKSCGCHMEAPDYTGDMDIQFQDASLSLKTTLLPLGKNYFPGENSNVSFAAQSYSLAESPPKYLATLRLRL